MASGKRNTIIGAVPSLFGITSHLSGTSAWAMFTSSTSSPRDPSMSCIISSWTESVRNDSEPDSSARAALVMSSFVGPSPPVAITMLLFSSSVLSELTIVSWSSPTESMRVTLIPAELSAREMCEELVSIIWPISISSPMVHMDACVISFCCFLPRQDSGVSF